MKFLKMKKFKYALLISILVIFIGQFAFAESTVSRGLDDDIMSPSLKNRSLEMRQKMDEKLKERSEKIKVNKQEAKNIDTMCAQAAVEARDTAIIAEFDTYSNAIKAALESRKISASEAWTKTTPSERNAARRVVNQTYNTASKNAHKNLINNRKTVWDKYRSDMKACGASAGIDPMGRISGGLSL